MRKNYVFRAKVQEIFCEIPKLAQKHGCGLCGLTDGSLAPPPAELVSLFTRPLDCFIKVFQWEIPPVCIFALLLGLNAVVANHRGKFHLKHRRSFVALTHRDSRSTTGG